MASRAESTTEQPTRLRKSEVVTGFKTTPWIWHNGSYIAWEEATLHVMSHVVHYGSSVFEGIRCYSTPDGPAIFRLRPHIRRFFDSARIHRMDLPFSIEEIEEGCRDLIRKNDLQECYLRPLALRGYGQIGVLPTGCPVETYLLTWPWGAYLGADALEKGVDVCVSSWQRPAPNTHPVMAKAGGNYVNASLMKMEAQVNGYSEAIATGPSGTLSEGSGQNLFLVRDGRILTPHLDGTMLPGITRDSVITIAREAGFEVVEKPIPREMLYTADEVFFTGTAAEVTPVRSVDRVKVGNGEVGPVTRRIQKSFLDIVTGKTPDTHDWLDRVA